MNHWRSLLKLLCGLLWLDYSWKEESLLTVSDNTSLKQSGSVYSGECLCLDMHVYSRSQLLDLKKQFELSDPHNRTSSILSTVPVEIRKHRILKHRTRRKRGRKGGLRQMIKRCKYRVPLPTLMLGNVRSVKNKTDELAACVAYHEAYRNSCALVLTETWLDETVPDSCVNLTDHSLVRADRSATESGKSRGGGVCLFINNKWCNNYIVKHTSCSPSLELLCVQCRPYYLPREICCVVFIIVYIPPSADKTLAVEEIAAVAMNTETEKPDAAVLILGDFNGASLHQVLPKYAQFIKCPTRGDKCLDLCYVNIQSAYKASCLPPLGCSDHNMILLRPCYKQKLKVSKPVERQVRQWDTESTEQLQGCLACTDWTVFQDSCTDINELTSTVTDYIHFCTDTCVPQKSIRSYPNNKPWVTKELRGKVKAKHQLLRSQDKEALAAVEIDLKLSIAKCKEEYRQRIESHFHTGNAKACWQGLKTLTGYTKSKSSSLSGNEEDLAEKLSTFYTRFEKPDNATILTSCSQTATQLTEEDTAKVLKSVLPNKAPGPDQISPRLIKTCADELTPVLTHIFNRSLKECSVPELWKESTIIPVPKKVKPEALNDFRPVALTSVVMKCFERLVLKHLAAQTRHHMDPNQFAYQPGRSVEDATCLLTHRILEHLDTPGTYVRVLFIDFSSAFNTMLPSKLYNKLVSLGVETSLCNWILSYLQGRTQRVRINSTLSSSATTNVGAPQGCVLSPVLFTLYTNDHRGQEPHTLVDKYADDTAVAGLISDSDEEPYRNTIDQLVTQCDSDNLELNVSKTKELIVDFRKGNHIHKPVNIKGTDVTNVPQYDYLGTTITESMSWNANLCRLAKKANKRMYHLRKLREFRVNQQLQIMFYRSVIESVLVSGIAAWGGGVTVQDKRIINRVRKCAERIIGVKVPNWESIYESRVCQMTNKILRDNRHPLHRYFQYLPSGRRLRHTKARTNRFKASFVPNSIRLHNRSGNL